MIFGSPKRKGSYPIKKWFLWALHLLHILRIVHILHMTHSHMLGKVEYGGGPTFKVVLEC